MSKKVFKEIVIAMLLCLAIILVLALVLYNYVPANKTLPEKVAYTTPDKVSSELASSSTTEEDQVITTYEVDNADMNNYENINSYNPGKANPFTRFVELPDGTVITNPKQNVDYSNTNSSEGATANNGGTSGTSTNGAVSGASTENSNNGGSATNPSGSSSGGTTGTTGGSNSGSNNGGEPGYYNYKNGK